MTDYTVLIDREVRLVFEGIEAASPEEAAAIACDKHPAAADDIDSCDGEDYCALVEEEDGPARSIEFQPERRRKAASGLLSTLKAAAELRRRWRSQDEDETIGSLEYMDGLDELELDAVIAEAESADILPRPTTATLQAALKSILPYAWSERASLREIWERRHGDPKAMKELAACDRALDEAEAALAGAETPRHSSSPTPAEKNVHDTLRYVAEMLSGFKPDLLHNVGLHVALEKTSAALDAFEAKAWDRSGPANPSPALPAPAAVQNEYDRTTEIVPGVFLDPSAAVYIADRQGEVVTWNHEEIAEDPSGSTDRLARFQIEHKPEEYSDRVHVKVDGEFDVAIIRTDEGVVVDVYPKDGSETIASTFAFDSEAEAPDSDAPAPAPETARFASFEIEPRIRHWEDGDPEKPDHFHCEEHEADMWRLYGTRHSQHSVCIGEYATRALAENVYAGITGRRYGLPS